MKFKKNSGFTLIEVLVALLIIAIVLASSTRAIGLAVADVHDSYVRQLANWVADNQSNQYALDGTYPDLGTAKKDVLMGGVEFILQTDVEATPNPYFRKVEIAVSEKSSPDHAIFKTVALLSQY